MVASEMETMTECVARSLGPICAHDADGEPCTTLRASSGMSASVSDTLVAALTRINSKKKEEDEEEERKEGRKEGRKERMGMLRSIS